MIRPLTPTQALAKMQDLCSRAEISTGEALDKLRRKGITGRTAEQIVQNLVDTRFIDDERFARAFVREKYLYARWGRIKIRQALRLKHVDSEYINAALDEEIEPETYAGNLLRLLHARRRQIPADTEPAAATARLLRFAAGRGFEPALIVSILRSDAFISPDNTDE